MKKRLSLILAGALLVGMLAGCGGQQSAAPQGSETGGAADVPKLEFLELEMYQVGEPARDYQRIAEKMNEIFERELNCRFNFTFTGWTDYANKYHLALSSGQNVDLIYTANWLNYKQMAKNGAYLELDELLPQYAPKVWEMVDKDTWDAARVNGSIYAVPGLAKGYVTTGFAYRADIGVEYGLPEPDTIENFEKYLDGIIAKNPGVVPMSFTTSSLAVGPVDIVRTLKRPYIEISGSGRNYGLYYNIKENNKELINYWFSEEFVEDCKLFKEWADRGYWSKSILSQQQDVGPLFQNGQIYIIANDQHLQRFVGTRLSVEGTLQGAKVEWIKSVDNAQRITLIHPTQDAMAIASVSRHPERSLMALELLDFNKELCQLSKMGEAGVDYEVGEKGEYVPLVAEDPPFGLGGFLGWAWGNKAFELPTPNSVIEAEYLKELEKLPSEPRLGGFSEDNSEYSSEAAALATVITQYFLPLEAGIVNDVDAAVELFRQKALEAGIEKIHSKYLEQWNAYVAEYMKD